MPFVPMKSRVRREAMQSPGDGRPYKKRTSFMPFIPMERSMRLPGLPLEQDNDYGLGQLCGWWAIGKECVRIGIYPAKTRNLASRVMAHVAAHAADNINEETFAAVWKAWKNSKQLDTTLQNYVTTLRHDPSQRITDGCSDADLMIATHWLLSTRPANFDQPRLFTYRHGDDGYKQYCMGKIFMNTAAADVHHRTDVILCNRSSIHWTATRQIEETTNLIGPDLRATTIPLDVPTLEIGDRKPAACPQNSCPDQKEPNQPNEPTNAHNISTIGTKLRKRTADMYLTATDTSCVQNTDVRSPTTKNQRKSE